VLGYVCIFLTLCYAKVNDLDISLSINDDVSRFDITVRQSTSVRIAKRIKDLNEEPLHFLQVGLRLCSDVLSQSWAINELGNQNHKIFVIEEVAHLADVLVAEALKCVSLTQESLFLRLVFEDFQHDPRSGQVHVRGKIHRAHSPFAQLSYYFKIAYALSDQLDRSPPAAEAET
jgi:hypothetical protein